jgi:uncharacterized protein (DUF1778 family)
MPKVQNATELIAFRVTKPERRLIEKAARLRGLRLSDYIRDMILRPSKEPDHLSPS